jgi:rhomboid family GlyGly-CTERM serine protease
MFNLPVQTKYSLAPLLIAIISIILALLEPLSSDLLSYDRNQLNSLQLWRLITGHFLHTNVVHLALNISGLTLLWALHGHYYPRSRYLTVFITLCLGISLGLYLFAPKMYWYVGLSGVLHGFFVIGAYFDIQHKYKTGWIMLVGLFLKVGHEQIYGASQDVAQLIAANVAIDAHLFGTITGCFIILFFFVVSKRQNSKECNDR